MMSKMLYLSLLSITSLISIYYLVIEKQFVVSLIYLCIAFYIIYYNYIGDALLLYYSQIKSLFKNSKCKLCNKTKYTKNNICADCFVTQQNMRIKIANQIREKFIIKSNLINITPTLETLKDIVRDNMKTSIIKYMFKRNAL